MRGNPSENNKIEKTVNSARLQIRVRIESENLLADYLLSLDLDLC